MNNAQGKAKQSKRLHSNRDSHSYQQASEVQAAHFQAFPELYLHTVHNNCSNETIHDLNQLAKRLVTMIRQS